MVETAKKIRLEFLKLNEVAKKISIDDFVRVMPAGKSQIKDIGTGGLQKDDFIDDELD